VAICLEYQAVYSKEHAFTLPLRLQLIAACVLLVLLGARVCIKLESTSLGYKLAHERQVAIDLDMQRRELELQRAVLLRPDNLAKNAGLKLGLKPAVPQQIYRLVGG
jgi:hypothetical protein